MEYAIKTKDLCKKYGDVMSVNNVDLKVPIGSIYGFLGPNGAGKSTTMKMLLGLIKPSNGKVEIMKKNVNPRNRLDILKNTGSLIESPSYYGHLSAYENLGIVAGLKGVDKKEIDYVLKIVRLTEHKDKKVNHYSLGMKQRLGIAAALIGSPKLLLLDEPTNGLDPAGIQEIRELICDLPKTYDMTILVSSHLLSEIDQMATDVGIIHNGELIFQDSLKILHEHSNEGIYLRTEKNNETFKLLRENNIGCKIYEKGLLLPKISDEQMAQCTMMISKKNIGILRIEERKKTLEEIFLSLIGKKVNI